MSICNITIPVSPNFVRFTNFVSFDKNRNRETKFYCTRFVFGNFYLSSRQYLLLVKPLYCCKFNCNHAVYKQIASFRPHSHCYVYFDWMSGQYPGYSIPFIRCISKGHLAVYKLVISARKHQKTNKNQHLCSRVELTVMLFWYLWLSIWVFNSHKQF